MQEHVLNGKTTVMTIVMQVGCKVQPDRHSQFKSVKWQVVDSASQGNIQ